MITDLRLLLLLAARPESLLCKKAELVVVAAAEVVAVGTTEMGLLMRVMVARATTASLIPTPPRANYKSRAIIDTTGTYLSDNVLSEDMSREVVQL